ncbi:MAG TPA: serine protease [Gemmataceae bacterium]|nr:serine protease [Gemmataceae bacterium]
MKRLALNCILVIALNGLSTASISAQEAPFEKVLSSTVWVEYVQGTQTKIGTGSLIDREQRLVVTCQHVMHDQKQANIYFPMWNKFGLMVNGLDYLRSKNGITGRVVATDDDRDLAILQLDRLPANVQALDMADKAPPAGTPIFLVGNSTPGAKTIADVRLWQQYSTKISRLAYSTQKLENEGMKQVHTWAIEIEALVSSGDSGGPVVDADGRLAGVTFAQNGKHGYAVDVEEVRIILDRYRHGKDPAPKNSMTGQWTVEVQPKDKPAGYFRMSFQDNGKLEWITNKSYSGKYELKDNRLTLNIPALKVNETLPINRTGNNQITFTSSGVPFTLTRR